jgi:hypothetical protein
MSKTKSVTDGKTGDVLAVLNNGNDSFNVITDDRTYYDLTLDELKEIWGDVILSKVTWNFND